jgi:hypothetical protein
MYEHKRGRESRERVEQGDGVVVVVVGRDVIGRVGMIGGRGGRMQKACGTDKIAKWFRAAMDTGREDSHEASALFRRIHSDYRI